MIKQQPKVQYLALVLLEACVKNCQRGLADVATEGVLDEMVQVVDDPETVVNVRNKVLVLIEAWGESGKLCYLPVYEVIYMVVWQHVLCKEEGSKRHVRFSCLTVDMLGFLGFEKRKRARDN
ncbi:VHS domain-containing protein [Carex littledalei]|uniref:VHS domain-containing protein n=1 Tax=Carex littledalei TaxID=544730 RepID=A0A833QIR9_9POAL|nr:VHS domain-containing protein [Carex littledalei]